MKTYKIYGVNYKLESASSSAPDAYALRGELLDEPPKGKKVGYVTMNDNSVIECYTKFNPLIVIIPTLLVVLALTGVIVYLLFFQNKDANIAGIPIKVGDDENIVSYNGFMSVSDINTISVNFQNGDYYSTIEVVGEGIESTVVEVEPGAYVQSIPVTYTTDKELIQAQIRIETETSTIEEDVMVEIPLNAELYTTTESITEEDSSGSGSSSSTDGYWKGEYIYGTDIKDPE